MGCDVSDDCRFFIEKLSVLTVSFVAHRENDAVRAASKARKSPQANGLAQVKRNTRRESHLQTRRTEAVGNSVDRVDGGVLARRETTRIYRVDGQLSGGIMEADPEVTANSAVASETPASERLSTGEASGWRPARISRFMSWLSTALTAALATGLVIIGGSLLELHASAVHDKDIAQPVSVRIQPLELVDSFEISNGFVGQLEAAQRTGLAFERSGKIVAIAVEEAAFVRKGEVLVQLDTAVLENQKRTMLAARDALSAQVELLNLTNQRRRTLNEKGFAAGQQLDEARFQLAEKRARIAETDGTIAGLNIQIEKSSIRAPFDGRVGARFMDIGAIVGPGQPVMAILQNAPPRMRVGLSRNVAKHLRIGTEALVRVAGRRYSAKLIRLRADLDPVTRTRIAVFELQATGDRNDLPYGVSGTVILSRTIRQTGAWLPVTALQSGTRGLWTVLTVNPGAKEGSATIASETVEIVHADENRAFVRGTFSGGEDIVVAGSHRVVVGQPVRIGKAARLASRY